MKCFNFGVGHHSTREEGMCIMEAAAYLAGEETPSPWGVIRIGLHSSLEPAFDSDERSIIWALTTAAANCLARAVLPEMSP